MAFTKGQRVKRVANAICGIPIGSTGTVVCDPDETGDIRCVSVDWDVGTPGDVECPGFMRHTLAPLTDPRASEFIADQERFSKLAEREKVGI